MKNETISFIFTALSLGFGFYTFIRFVVVNYKERKKQLNELLAEEESITENVKASIISKECYIEYKGIKYPKHTVVYKIIFSTEKKENIKYTVSETLYNSLNEGDNGTLVTINGNFFDFQKLS